MRYLISYTISDETQGRIFDGNAVIVKRSGFSEENDVRKVEALIAKSQGAEPDKVVINNIIKFPL